MELDVGSLDPQLEGEHRLVPYDTGDYTFVGVELTEPLGVFLGNTRKSSVAAKLTINGINVLTGQPARHGPDKDVYVLGSEEILLIGEWAKGTPKAGRVFRCNGVDLTPNEPVPYDPDVLGGPGLIAVEFYFDRSSSDDGPSFRYPPASIISLRLAYWGELQRYLRARNIPPNEGSGYRRTEQMVMD
jgi:hypothetical protein